ncbi:MAG: hypothetical protein KDD44_05080, partial [Bdellovibrionales bacterium]|nr:hypothetical protein [Bdellovibrionales bacterium]
SLNACFDALAVREASAVLSAFSMTLVAALFLFPLARRYQSMASELTKHRRTLHARGALECLFMSSKLLALQFLAPQYVSALVRVSLLLTVFGGHLAFQERDLKRRTVCALLIVGGTAVILLSAPLKQ